MALVRDSLKDSGVESVSDACCGNVAAIHGWYLARILTFGSLPPGGKGQSKHGKGQRKQLQPTGGEGMQRLAGLSQEIYRRREPTIISSLTPSYIWQTDPPIPSKIVVDLSNHIPTQLPVPLGWEIQQRNARVLITDTRQHTFGLDAAQYGMLLALDRDHSNGRGGHDRLEPTEPFLLTLKLVCMAQRWVDPDYAISWNLHVITCVQQLRKAAKTWLRYLQLSWRKFVRLAPKLAG